MIKTEAIQKANSQIETMTIGKGDKAKEYAPVHQRVKAFRMIEPGGSIQTEIIEKDGDTVIMKASVYDSDSFLLATGFASETKNRGMVNGTSHIENCETSAVGRALANCGIGIDASIASLNEAVSAINQQQEEIANAMEKPDAKINKKQVSSIIDQCAVDGVSIKQICDLMGVQAIADMTFPQYWALTNKWSENVKRIKEGKAC